MVKQSIKFIVAGILATLFVTGATTGHAQNYPVQAFATLTPPYSLKLSDYAAPEGNRMRITLLLKDAQQPTLDVRLKLTIEGNGVKLTTNPSFHPTPITLLSSTLYEVSYDELSDYFLPQNLIADGISMSALTSSGMLPEGLYRFKVEAMEAHRDVPVSNTAMAIGWLMLNDPPQWISPRQGQKLTAGEPQGIQFLWSRCGMSSPNAALSTQYEVTMVEMVQPNMDPNVAIVTLPPIYQEVSPIENLFYGPDKPELIPGHSYAVRIRAFDTRGIDLYRNGGYSPVITFRYGDPCIAPVFLSSDNISEQTADLSWNSTPLATNYRVRFRENGADLSDWYEEPATQTSYTVKNLKPDCTYEYQVQSECGSLPSDYSVSGTLRTRKLENQNQTCSQQLDNANMPTNRDPLSALHTNQTFLAGVMPVKVTSIQGSNGIFTGTGVVYLPIAGVGLSCTFNRVGINTNYQLISGEVITTKSKNTSIYGSGGVTVLDTLHLDNPIDTIIVNPNGDVAVVSGGDTTFIPLANQPVVIYPPTGGGAGTTTGGTTGNDGGDGAGAGGSTGGGGTTTYGDGPIIVENGTVKPYNPAGDPPTALFHKASISTYGYDSLAYEALRSYYPVATINGKEVEIPYKALPVSGSDNVVLELKPGSSKLTTDSLTIDVQTNAKVMSRSVMGNNKLMVSLQGLSEGEEPIMVRYTKHDADGKTEQVDIGAAKAVVYQPQPMKLVVVPLAGTTAPNKETLQSQLTAIYGQAVTSWTVTVTAPFAYTIPGGQLEFGSSEMASSYTEGMNNLIDAYKEANPTLEDGTYYLFVVPRFSDATLQGYMPRARRFGFIAQSSTDARTLAHELGHGAFNLEHTFPVLPQGTTDNLMDYNGGTRLIKPQWDLIHNPELTTGLLDDETDGASKKDPAQVVSIINKIREANSVPVLAPENQSVINELDISSFGMDCNTEKMDIDNNKDIPITVSMSYTTSKHKINDPTTFQIDYSSDNGVDYSILTFSNNKTNFLTIKCLKSDMLTVIRYIMNEDDSSPIFATSNGKYLKEGGIAYISNDEITGAPKMPNLSFKYVATLVLTQMKLNIVYDQLFNSGSPQKPYKAISDSYEEQGTNIQANTEWKPVCKNVVGGNAILTWSDGISSGFFKFNIRGINPSRSEIIKYLEQIQLMPQYWFIVGKMRRESSLTQFNYVAKNFRSFDKTNTYLSDDAGLRGLPYYGPPNGWGLGQLDNWVENGKNANASYIERWNWKANLDKVKFILEANKSVVVNKMKEALAIEQAWNGDENHKDDKVIGCSDRQEGPYTFSHVNSTLFPSIDLGKTDNSKKSFIDALYIKMFNSGGNRLFYQIKQDVDPITHEKLKPEWIIDDQACYNGKCWNYVKGVCDLNN